MYYCGDNQMALESQKSIGNAFLKLMNEKRYCEITVRAICIEADVSRQTFYSLFQTKENVISYLMQRDCTHSKEDCLMHGELSLAVMCDSFARFIYANFDFLKLMMEHELYCVIYKSIYQMFMECDRQFKHKNEIYSFLTGGITSYISSVVMDDANKDIDYLRETMRFLFRGEFFK
ncbi:hypothetical protein P261_00256 [Lachnospiraceae bacterium TWA4]|nr:hypothetical protein P261_00256 [Lachnospiraceae bacterium TWA4]